MENPAGLANIPDMRPVSGPLTMRDLETAEDALEGSPGTGVYIPPWLVTNKVLGHKRTRRGKRNRGKGKKGDGKDGDAFRAESDDLLNSIVLFPQPDPHDSNQSMRPVAVLPTPKMSSEVADTQRFQQLRAVLLQHNLKQAAASFQEAPGSEAGPSAQPTRHLTSATTTDAATYHTYSPTLALGVGTQQGEAQVTADLGKLMQVGPPPPQTANNIKVSQGPRDWLHQQQQTPTQSLYQQQQAHVLQPLQQEASPQRPLCFLQPQRQTSWGRHSAYGSSDFSSSTLGDSTSSIAYACSSRDSSANSLSSSRLSYQAAAAPAAGEAGIPRHLLRQSSLAGLQESAAGYDRNTSVSTLPYLGQGLGMKGPPLASSNLPLTSGPYSSYPQQLHSLAPYHQLQVEAAGQDQASLLQQDLEQLQLCSPEATGASTSLGASSTAMLVMMMSNQSTHSQPPAQLYRHASTTGAALQGPQAGSSSSRFVQVGSAGSSPLQAGGLGGEGSPEALVGTPPNNLASWGQGQAMGMNLRSQQQHGSQQQAFCLNEGQGGPAAGAAASSEGLPWLDPQALMLLGQYAALTHEDRRS